MATSIPVERLLEVRKIVSHRSCADGAASALVLLDAYRSKGIEPEVVFLGYGTPEHERLAADPGLLFCDMTPHGSRIEEFCAAGSIVLDHHKTQQHIVVALQGVYADEPGVSGAVLAYREVWQALRGAHGYEKPVERFARLAGQYDTWQRSAPGWSIAWEQAETLRFYPFPYLRDMLARGGFAAIEEACNAVGTVLVARKLEDARRSVQEGHQLALENPFMEFAPGQNSVMALVTNDPACINEAAELAETGLVIAFRYLEHTDGELALSVSLRSRERNGTQVDCGRIAKHLGGGGHVGAAGFTVRGLAFSRHTQSKTPYEVIDAVISSANMPF